MLFLAAAVLTAYTGTTPKLDGVISPGEYPDAAEITGVTEVGSAIHTNNRSERPGPERLGQARRQTAVLRLRHHRRRPLRDRYPSWLPDNNPKAHELTREGYPWFGDEMEILINATNKWKGDESVAGNGESWQMVCNLTKSRLGGIGVGGLLEGEPRRSESAWNTYQNWIRTGAQQCVAKRNLKAMGTSSSGRLPLILASKLNRDTSMTLPKTAIARWG